MADEDYPNKFKLRDYQMERKPLFSHAINSILNNNQPRKKVIVEYIGSEYKPITKLPIRENAPEVPNANINMKRTSPMETSSMPRNTSNSSEDLFESSSETSLSEISIPAINSAVSQVMNMPEEILQQERQIEFLKDRYPGYDLILLHHVLMQVDFDLRKAIYYLNKNFKTQRSSSRSQKRKLSQRARRQISHPPSPKTKHKRILNTDNNQNKLSKRIKYKRIFINSDSDSSDGNPDQYDQENVLDSDEEVSNKKRRERLSRKKQAVLDFFRLAKINELALMSCCSRKKAEIIIGLRPFKGWLDLTKKLRTKRYLGTDLLNSAQQVLTKRHNIKILMNQCVDLSEQIEIAVAIGAGVKTQPKILNPSMKLTSHQMVGLNWLAAMHIQGVNGILADEMGLGKTVQVVALLAHLKEIGADKTGIPHLIIVPSSTMNNWCSEFERWCPSLKVFTYHGTIEERRQFRMNWHRGGIVNYDVIVTTYSMVSNTAEEKKHFKYMQLNYIVFDEAHMLKNMNTLRYENLIKIRAMKRLLLTGTPLQNNLLELMSLLNFVMPSIFEGIKEDLKFLFQRNGSTTKQNKEDMPPFEQQQIEQAKRIMKPFVLRRLKTDVLKDLPSKDEKVEFVPMVPTQKEFYENLVESFQYNREQDFKYNGIAIMSDLRKVANHPLLKRYFYHNDELANIAKHLANEPNYKGKKENYITEDLGYMSDFEIHTLTLQYDCLKSFQLPDNLITTSGKFLYFDRILPPLKNDGHRVLIFSQYVIMLNIMEEYLKIRGHTYLRLDGSTAVNVRQELIDLFTDDSNIFIFLLSTKAGGLGINLTAADTVIIHDIDFNPYNDKQAEDRCHRMGQNKHVSVIRLISQGTIEEGMWHMNKEKLQLEKEITTEETENAEAKSVVRLLSSALGIDSAKTTYLGSPKKTL